MNRERIAELILRIDESMQKMMLEAQFLEDPYLKGQLDTFKDFFDVLKEEVNRVIQK